MICILADKEELEECCEAEEQKVPAVPSLRAAAVLGAAADTRGPQSSCFQVLLHYQDRFILQAELSWCTTLHNSSGSFCALRGCTEHPGAARAGTVGDAPRVCAAFGC